MSKKSLECELKRQKLVSQKLGLISKHNIIKRNG